MGAPERPFGRFIPKEHVGEAAVWEFQSLAGGEQPRGTERLLSDRERRAYERGQQDGFAAGEQAAMLVRSQHGREMARVLDELRGRFAELESDGAEQVLQLALAIARQVVRREVEVDATTVLPALREAVASVIDQQTHPRVHLNPADLDHLRVNLEADGLLKGCRFVPDPGVKRGGCRVETAHSDVDASIESRWQRVLAAVGIDPRRAPRDIDA
ncbi:MAG: flagellar assembly protein FliH [Burkholderiaceae bacterium]|nr:flagellar assembly protein FliH [Burkholderiaceae bacterium]